MTNTLSFAQQYSTERLKARHRHVWLFPAATLAFLTLWSAWNFRNASPEDLAQGYQSMLYQLPILNTILLPLMIAVISSRLCDMEIKGNTLKLLCTLQRQGAVFDCKLLFSLRYLAVFCLGENILIILCGLILHFTDAFHPHLFLFNFVCIFMVGTALMIIQQTLSLLFDNQLIPLITGLAGSFLGLFSLYFPPTVSKFILWNYFGAFLPYGMDWDSTTRVIRYYEIPFPTGTFLGFLFFTILIYFLGKYLFKRKEL